MSTSIYYTLKNKRQQYKKSTLKIISSTWNDDFELPDALHSISIMEDYIKYIIRKHITLTNNSSIHIYDNKVNNRLEV